MFRHFRDRRAIALSLALAAALGSANGAQGGSLSFRNDTSGPVIVQAMSVVQGRVVAGTRHVLQSGATSSDLVTRPGNKLIMIVNARRPTQTLYMDTVPFAAAGVTRFYSIQAADPPQANGRQNRPPAGAAGPRVKLVEIQVPVNPMPGTNPTTPRR
jgi:hypothetical protein